MRLAAFALTGLLLLAAGAGDAGAQLVKPAPSSPTSEAIGPAAPFVDDRIGKLGFNFGAGPLLLVNLNPEVRKVTETGFGISGRFGYELRFGLIPEVTVDFAHALLKGQGGGAQANSVALQAGARYIFRRGLFNPFLGAGAGYFINATSDLDVKVLNSAFSFNVGGGLDVRVHTHAYLELWIRYLGYLDGGVASTLLFNAALTLYY